jgi:putative CocE/NonD family hydrolase
MQIWHDTTNATDPEPSWVTTSSRWPPVTETKQLYLGAAAALTTASPSAGEPGDTYVSPTVSAGTEDGDVFGQRNELWKVPGTPGGAVGYTTTKLAKPTELLGPMSLDLWLSSTASDTNLQATITEVRPDGEEVYVARGWLKASMRALDTAASTPTMPVQTDLESDVQPLVPGEPTFMRLAVNPIDYVFRAGSRIRLIIDTPSQTGGWNFEPLANGGINTVLHDAAHQSELVFGTGLRVKAPTTYPVCDTLLNQPCRPDAFPESNPLGEVG